MSKKIIFPLALMLLSACLFSQHKQCGTDEMMKKQITSDPAAKKSLHNLENFILNYNTNSTANKSISSSSQFTIPVVFHILHINGSEKISEAQVKSAVQILNRDFRKKNSDTINIVSSFTAVAADSKIEFRLATKDPNGNCTNGIIYHFDNNTTSWDADPGDYLYTWDPGKYLNIYVVRNITFGAAGYTYLPGTAPGAMDAIVMLHDYTGNIGTSNSFSSRALTHEAGHWFGLNHIWGSGAVETSCGNDGIADTPLTMGHTSCNLNSNVCTPGVIENVQNYMDYAYCSNMFTNDQAGVMQGVLTSIGFNRQNLSSASNLLATGALSTITVCPPVANFNPANNIYEVCLGVNMNFFGSSSSGTVTNYSWTVSPTATTSATNQSNLSVTFPSPGIYTVGLTVQNSGGSSSLTKTVSIIDPTPNYAVNMIESFETGSAEPANWSVINPDAGTTWAQYPGIGSQGNKCFFIDGPSNPSSEEDFLRTGIFDLQSNPTTSLTFDISYARLNSSHNDIFKVQATKNCGSTWIDIYTPVMSTLASQTGGEMASVFTPSSLAQWKTVELHNQPNYSTLSGNANVMFRFYFKEDAAAGFGNRLYIDNINFISASVGLNERMIQSQFQIYPNPASQSSHLKFRLDSRAKVSVKITDIRGSLVKTISASDMEAGEHTLQLHTGSELAEGMYFVELGINDLKLVKKLIVR